MDAFTQQAYTEVKDIKSDNHIKFHLQETDLWNVINNLKDVIDILNKDGYREKYIVLRKHIGTKNLPSYSNLILTTTATLTEWMRFQHVQKIKLKNFSSLLISVSDKICIAVASCGS